MCWPMPARWASHSDHRMCEQKELGTKTPVDEALGLKWCSRTRMPISAKAPRFGGAPSDSAGRSAHDSRHSSLYCEDLHSVEDITH